MKMTSKTTDSAAYLVEMEKVKKQYAQYVEVSQIYKLPIFESKPEPRYEPPSIENPLTTDAITLTK